MLYHKFFLFPLRKVPPRRKLVHVRHDESSEKECQDEDHDKDNSDDVVQNSESEQNLSELLAQLKTAKDEVARLQQLLGKAKLESVEF